MEITFNNPIEERLNFELEEPQAPVGDDPLQALDPEKNGTLNVEEEPIEEEKTKPEDTPIEVLDGENAPDVANSLYKLGFIKDIPEDINPAEMDEASLKKLLEYRDNKLIVQSKNEGAKLERQRLISKFSPALQQAMSYNLDNPNADEKDIIDFVTSLHNTSNITSLDPEKDATKIVKEYYKTLSYTEDEIAEKVEDLISLDKLEREAKRLKPKLDAKAKSIVDNKRQEAQRIANMEAQLQDNLKQRTLEKLQGGSIAGVPLNQTEAQYLYDVVMNNEVPVVIKGRRVEMGYLEALIIKEKYQGNLENVMLAGLVLGGGMKALEKYFGKEARKKEIVAAEKEIKFTNSKKKSISQVIDDDNDDSFVLNL